MKLNQKQLLQIEKHLDYRKLTQVDLRNEVLDHMALNIEEAMENHNQSFEDAFNTETQLWNEELKDYSSLWLGLIWVGPKLMMKKCVKEIKRMYLFTALLAISSLFTAFIISKVFLFEEQIPQLDNIIGGIYLGCFLFMLVTFFKIKASDFKTTYSYLFKINAIGVASIYLVYNPIWSDFIPTSLIFNENIFAILFHSSMLVYGYQFWVLYLKHLEAKKTLMA